MLSAVLAVPMVLGVGTALDLTTIAQTRSRLQQALDAASLSIAREGSTVTEDRAQELAEEFLKANFPATLTSLRVNRQATSFTVQAETKADTSFGNLFGYGKWPVSAKSTADIAYLPYEIALVLDTTGSMKGGKLASMKDAVIGLIDTMSANISDKSRLKFAMVPFSSFVNVGAQFAPSFDKKGRVDKKTGAQWLDIEGKSEIPQVELKKGISRFEYFNNLHVPWGGCVETRQPTKKGAYDVTDLPPTKKDPNSLFVPALSIDEPDSAEFQNSYIASSADPLDESAKGDAAKDSKYGLADAGTSLVDGVVAVVEDLLSADRVWTPVATEITETKGPNGGCDSQPIVPLSTDYQGLKLKVDALQASGNTNIMEGVAWGWRVLSPGQPFTEGAAKSSPTKKVIILLTDGSNTFGVRENELGSTYSSFGFAVDQRLMSGVPTASSSNEVMNGKTLAACTNAKSDGIEIFTIRLEEPNVTTGMMLKDCATDADHFFDAPSRNQLDAVFSAIRDKITRVRVSS